MDTKTALGAAGGIALTIVGAVSALVLTVGGPAAAEPATPSEAVVEYVDQYGNTIDSTQLDASPTTPEVVVTTDNPAGDTVLAAPEEAPAEYPEAEAEAYEEEEDEAYEAEEEEYEDD